MALFAIGGVAWLLWPATHRATASPQPGVEITLSLRAMASLHSDWHRDLAVSYNGDTITTDLMEDTGWWRGSNLYRHVSGAFVLHEGQAGCVGFTLEPLAFDPGVAAQCSAAERPPTPVEGRSAYYENLIYLGHFFETWRDPDAVRIKFADPTQTPEVKLPAPL